MGDFLLLNQINNVAFEFRIHFLAQRGDGFSGDLEPFHRVFPIHRSAGKDRRGQANLAKLVRNQQISNFFV